MRSFKYSHGLTPLSNQYSHSVYSFFNFCWNIHTQLIIKSCDFFEKKVVAKAPGYFSYWFDGDSTYIFNRFDLRLIITCSRFVYYKYAILIYVSDLISEHGVRWSWTWSNQVFLFFLAKILFRFLLPQYWFSYVSTILKILRLSYFWSKSKFSMGFSLVEILLFVLLVLCQERPSFGFCISIW